MIALELALIAGMVSIAVQVGGDLTVLRHSSGRGGGTRLPAWGQIAIVGVFAVLWGSFTVVFIRNGVEKLRR